MQKGQDSGKLEPDSNGWRQGFGGGRLDDVRAITIDYKKRLYTSRVPEVSTPSNLSR